MSAALPEHIEPLRLARQETRIQGSLPLAGMARLCAALLGSEGEARVDWLFHLDMEGRPVLDGTVKADLLLRCQRCLAPVSCPVQAITHLGILRPGQSEDDLPAECEPLETTGEPMSLREMVEDELILALPLAPLHPVCPHNEYADQAPAEEQEIEARPNPFAVLGALRR